MEGSMADIKEEVVAVDHPNTNNGQQASHGANNNNSHSRHTVIMNGTRTTAAAADKEGRQAQAQIDNSAAADEPNITSVATGEQQLTAVSNSCNNNDHSTQIDIHNSINSNQLTGRRISLQRMKNKNKIQ